MSPITLNPAISVPNGKSPGRLIDAAQDPDDLPTRAIVTAYANHFCSHRNIRVGGPADTFGDLIATSVLAENEHGNTVNLRVTYDLKRRLAHVPTTAQPHHGVAGVSQAHTPLAACSSGRALWITARGGLHRVPTMSSTKATMVAGLSATMLTAVALKLASVNRESLSAWSDYLRSAFDGSAPMTTLPNRITWGELMIDTLSVGFFSSIALFLWGAFSEILVDRVTSWRQQATGVRFFLMRNASSRSARPEHGYPGTEVTPVEGLVDCAPGAGEVFLNGARIMAAFLSRTSDDRHQVDLELQFNGRPFRGRLLTHDPTDADNLANVRRGDIVWLRGYPRESPEPFETVAWGEGLRAD